MRSINKFVIGIGVCAAVAPVGGSQAETRSTRICEQTVTYNVEPPAVDLSPEFRAFLGVWAGSWNRQLCSVLIVDDIETDGRVRGRYVFGSNPAWYIPTPGIDPLRGRIANNVLTFRPGDAVIEYRMVSPDELAGSYTRNRAPSTGSFIRAEKSVAAPGTTTTAEGRRFLWDDEIRARVVGRAFTWSNGTKVSYGTDGTYTSVNFDGRRRTGRFIVKNGKLCISVDNGQTTACFLYFSDAKGLSVVIEGGGIRLMTPST